MSTAVPEELGGRYELGRLLGRGGMAEVHIGRDARLGRSVAVKMLRPDMARDPGFQARFRREAHSAASLNHPAIVAVYDTGEDEVAGRPIPYIVMEYVEGSTLRELQSSGNRLMPERALEIVDGVLAALAYSHQQGIVHRDIKPANVMLNANGDVKVMDFGIARALADGTSTMTQTAAVIGTAQYLSPEQARGEQVDARSDLYSTGCLLYELLTGRPPFVGDSAVSVAVQHVREEPVPPSAIDPDVPAAVDAIVLKALTKDRDHRYQTADEMRADIARALTGRRVEPPPPTAVMQRTAVAATPAATSTSRNLGPDRGREPQRNGAGRALGYTLLGLAVLAVFVVAALIGKSLFDNRGPKQVPVPDVRGLSQAAATRQLTVAGLTADPITTGNSATVPKGNVISQDPQPKIEVDEGKSVALTVSAGVKQAKVPTLVGLSLNEARNALREQGLNLGRAKAVASDKDRNVVTKADPAQDSTVADGSQVNVEYASGSNTVPNVKGKSAQDARNALEDAGFKVASPTERENPDASKEGTVIEQSPAGRSITRLGSTISLVVATAPPPSTPTPTPSTPPPAVTPPPATDSVPPPPTP